MRYAEALTALIDQQHDRNLKWTHKWSVPTPTRDEVAVSDENIHIAAELFGNHVVGDAFYDDTDSLDFGVLDNGREYGLTVTVGDWTFCAYQHRNSDMICIEGCPTNKVLPYGPYGGADKFDVLLWAGRREYEVAAAGLIAGMKLVGTSPKPGRRTMKLLMRSAAEEYIGGTPETPSERITTK